MVDRLKKKLWPSHMSTVSLEKRELEAVVEATVRSMESDGGDLGVSFWRKSWALEKSPWNISRANSDCWRVKPNLDNT